MKKNICVIMLAVFALWGCGKEPTVSGGESEVVLNFYTWVDEESYMREMVSAYEQKNPGIKINITFIPNSEFHQGLEIAINGGEEVDLFTSTKPSLAVVNTEKGYAMELSDLLKDVDTSGYGEWIDELKIYGKVYMIPYRLSQWVVYYNKDLFDEAGIPYPAGDWTWEEYTEIARRLTTVRPDGSKVYGSLSYDLSQTWWRVPARTAGKENPLKDEDLAAFKKAALWNYNMAYEYEAQPKYTEFTGTEKYDYNRLFLEGNIAMYFGGDWCLPILNEGIEKEYQDIRYDVASLPYWESEESYSLATAAVMQVSSASSHPKEAFDFLTFVCGEEGAKILAANHILPAWDSPEIRNTFQDNLNVPIHSEYFFDDKEVVFTFMESGFDEAIEVVRKYVNQYLLKETGLEETFRKIENEFYEKGLKER